MRRATTAALAGGGAGLRRTLSRSEESMAHLRNRAAQRRGAQHQPKDRLQQRRRRVLWSHLDDNSGSETSSLGLPDPPAAFRAASPAAAAAGGGFPSRARSQVNWSCWPTKMHTY